MVKKRTQIYLDPEVHRRLKERAKEEGISLAELIRRIARDYCAKRPCPGTIWPSWALAKAGRPTSPKNTMNT